MLVASVLASLIFAFATPLASTPVPDQIQGTVFEDLDRDGVMDEGEPGLGGVGVSNGEDVVLTDDSGRYTLEVDDDDVVFVIKPRGFQVLLDEVTLLPRHYYVHKPAGSPRLRYKGVTPTGDLPSSINFPLHRQEESSRFRILCFGDTQPRTQEEVDFTSHDVVEELIGFDGAFGVTLGDLVFDDLDLLDPISRSIGLIGVPWYHVIGNHDVNQDAPSNDLSTETYQRVFGPAYHSFNYGDVHFIALNDIFWEGRRYHAELGERQRKFIANDLEHVDDDKLIVLMMHIPLVELRDREELFEILSDYPYTFSLAAHWHRQAHFYMGEDDHWKGEQPHHHLVHGTACGGWWTGRPDELGIPHATMSDGTPNGYSIIEFDGTDYRVTYKAARRPTDYQMNIEAPEAVTAGETSGVEIVTNIFAGSERDEVHMRVGRDGKWKPMTQFDGRAPRIIHMKSLEQVFARRIAKERGIQSPTEDDIRQALNDYRFFNGRPLPNPGLIDHLWKANLPESLDVGYHLIEIRWKNQFGNESIGRRILGVTESSTQQ